ncbi:MAG: phosphoribosylamine--glycine ligase [Chloroflexi bacterium]|nr:phosphoribosylamine--glycine ligase [Chloroflexota bacterium]
MNVLIVGNGAREHAIAWKLVQSTKLNKLYAAPGNGGLSQVATNAPIQSSDIQGLLTFAKDNHIDLTIVGPEIPLDAGIVDAFEAEGLRIFGPSRLAARLESSKAFAKDLFKKYDIPTARSETFSSSNAALEYVSDIEMPIVIKADGLAAGKGVTIANTIEEANNAITDCLDKDIFGNAGRKIVIEEYLIGQEVSVFTFSDGKNLSDLISACDYKRAYDLDMGPNTGGMGSFSPPLFWNEELSETIRTKVMLPVIRGMENEGHPYKGVLYAGIILTTTGPKVLEFNCRFGDPETQVILPRLETDLIEIALSVAENRLHETAIRWSNKSCVGVVLAARGYPGGYDIGFELHNVHSYKPDSIIFHAGTRFDDEKQGQLVSDGGRILTVVGRHEDMDSARELAYETIARIGDESTYYRKDIALNTRTKLEME